MKMLSIICLFAVMACSHNRNPASLSGQPVAHDSMALGNIKADATKRLSKEAVCFDINMAMKGVSQEKAMPANWTVAWVDHNEQYHLIKMNQRDPASVPKGGQVVAPYGAYEEWNNSFTACAPKAEFGQVKSLVLTPKELPYREDKSLRLNWN